MKRFMRTLLSLVIICTMAFVSLGMAAFARPVNAASKPALSKKAVTLKKGRSTTIRLKNATKKVVWKSSNSKVVKVVKKKGKYHSTVTVKGLKKGKAIITAKLGKKTYKCRVTVKYTKPKPEKEIEIREMSASSKNLSAKFTAEDPGESIQSSDITQSAADFSFMLMNHAVAADRAAGKQTNVLLSPDSVLTAMAMTENGAATSTLAEMENTLAKGFTAEEFNLWLSGLNRRLEDSDQYIYNVSNSIWAREGMVDVRDDFLKKNLDLHRAEFWTSPFSSETVSDINAWVYNHTRNMIDNIISELSEDARMVLVNTVAFEGQWMEPFGSGAVMDGKFTNADGTKKTVKMLHDCEYYRYFELKEGKAFVKYYGASDAKSQGSSIAFVGMLPPEGMSADDYLSSLDGKSFVEAFNNSKSAKVNLTLPKFKGDYDIALEEILKDMGIVTAFTNDADFSAMHDPTPETPALRIDKVLHKTHIELDENGTKAAAATAVIMEKATAIMHETIQELRFDRPFAYAIVDVDSGMPLFIGEINSL
ncbi:MAG: serpin family protein [Mogibacterium sp.]|nr:serpin family protein [Mogibacterium sp.]